MISHPKILHFFFFYTNTITAPNTKCHPYILQSKKILFQTGGEYSQFILWLKEVKHYLFLQALWQFSTAFFKKKKFKRKGRREKERKKRRKNRKKLSLR